MVECQFLVSLPFPGVPMRKTIVFAAATIRNGSNKTPFAIDNFTITQSKEEVAP